MHEVLIRGGSVVDGSGSARRSADVAIDAGRVSEIGSNVGAARRTIDADGLIVAPGFIDVHTHLDVQGFWDPYLSPSPLHGVSTVIGGNCGFSVAPLDPGTAAYIQPMLARVEGMPLASLEAGVPWDWTTTEDYLSRLDGRLAINAGFLVGHCALRRLIMREASTERAATQEEIAQMQEVLRAGLGAGALGFSSTWSSTHNDAAGQPVPSRWATAAELIALAATCGELPGTSLEFLPGAVVWEEAAKQVMIDMSVAAQRPLNWNLIYGSAHGIDDARAKLAVSERARAAGGEVVGLTMPYMAGIRLSFLSGFLLDAIDGWSAPMALAPAAKLALLADPVGRARLAEMAATSKEMTSLADWGAIVILECFTPATKPYQGRRVSDIAAEEAKTAFDALVDIVVADELRTSFTNRGEAVGDSPQDWAARCELWLDPRTVIGGADTGAHLDMISTFSFATDLLGRGVRQQGLISTEQAVHLLTQQPADLYGLTDRGRLAAGAVADVVVFDETTVGPTEVTTRFDLPGGAGRLYAEADGIEHLLVSGEPVVASGKFTGSRTGVLLRSGQHTATPSMT
jgi:N-acyl-D-aspartate/D-glutamate deacylase